MLVCRALAESTLIHIGLTECKSQSLRQQGRYNL
jgi:hypothetical protein